MEERRRLSTTSRFSSPGTPKIRSTPSFSRAATRTSDPFIFGCLAWEMLEEFPRDRGGYKHEDERPPSRGAMRPRFAGNFLTLQSEGAGNTGCTLHPRSRVQQCTKQTHTSIQVQRRQSGIPCAMVLRLISRSPRRSGFLVTVAGGVLTANLTPASRRQDHTTLPSAFVPFVNGTISVHRIPRPTSVTIAKRPSFGTGPNSNIPVSTRPSSEISEIPK